MTEKQSRGKSPPAVKRKLTKTVVEGAQPHPDGRSNIVVWDSRLTGFGLRVRQSGAKSFVYVYRSGGKPRWLTIKAHGPDDAYEQARALASRHFAGGDPAEERAEERRETERVSSVPTVGDVLETFVREHARKNLKPKTWREYERVTEKILRPRIGKIKIGALKTEDVATMYRELRQQPRRSTVKKGRKPEAAVTQATGAVRVLSSAMSWATEAGLRPAELGNPAKIRLTGGRQRRRLFSDAEVSRLLACTDSLEADGRLAPPVARGLRLLFATGCRAGEICGLRWDYVDLDEGIFSWPDTKTGTLEKPITDEAEDILRGAERTVGAPWVCPSSLGGQMRVETLEGGFERVMAAAGVEAKENATLHLIRHWFATKTYTDQSLPLRTQMAIVGHSSVATAMRYAHLGRDELAQAARDAARRRKDAIRAAGQKGKVVELRREP